MMNIIENFRAKSLKMSRNWRCHRWDSSFTSVAFWMRTVRSVWTNSIEFATVNMCAMKTLHHRVRSDHRWVTLIKWEENWKLSVSDFQRPLPAKRVGTLSFDRSIIPIVVERTEDSAVRSFDNDESRWSLSLLIDLDFRFDDITLSSSITRKQKRFHLTPWTIFIRRWISWLKKRRSVDEPISYLSLVDDDRKRF